MLNIQKNIPLAKYTTFRIGGSARFFAEVENEDDLKEALKYAKKNNLDFFALGGGSNLLVNDKGFGGIAIKMKLNNFKIDINNNEIETGAGAPLAKIVKKAAENNLTGMEWAAGIPGTVGGAVRGNARAFGRDIGMAVESVEAVDINNMQVNNYSNSVCKFKYFGSMFKKNPNLIIISARIKLEKGDKEKSQREAAEIIKKRISMQPQESSPGSFFLNPIVSDKNLRSEFEKDTGKIPKDEKLPAGWLIDKVGLLGKKIGGAMVSEKHANFIINTGNATAEDVIMLASYVKQQVRDKFGVELTEEVQYIGF